MSERNINNPKGKRNHKFDEDEVNKEIILSNKKCKNESTIQTEIELEVPLKNICGDKINT